MISERIRPKNVPMLAVTLVLKLHLQGSINLSFETLQLLHNLTHKDVVYMF